MNEEITRKNMMYLWVIDRCIESVFEAFEGIWQDPAIGGYYKIWLKKEFYYKIISSIYKEEDNFVELKFIKEQACVMISLIPQVKADLKNNVSQEVVDNYIKSNSKGDEDTWDMMYRRARYIIKFPDESAVFYLQELFLRF